MHKLRQTGKAVTHGHPTLNSWCEQTEVNLPRVGTEGSVGPNTKGFILLLPELEEASLCTRMEGRAGFWES